MLIVLSFVNKQKFPKTFQSICDIVPCFLMNLLTTALVRKNISKKFVLYENNNTSIRHLFCCCVKICWVKFKWKFTTTATSFYPIKEWNGFSISYFLFRLLLNLRFLDLNVLLSHLLRQSPANFISVLNISATAHLFFFLATFNTHSLNCNKALLSLYCN